MSEGFPNPYLDEREKSDGELAQEYASLFLMASLLFDITLTDREKEAVPVLIGAIMRERKKVDLVKLTNALKGFLPDAR